MKPTERILIYSSLILSIVFWHRSCSSKRPIETITINVPKVVGKFEQSKPLHIDFELIHKREKDTIYLIAQQNNDSLMNAYQDLKTEYERFKLFQSFVSVKKFNQNFEDKYLKLKVSGLVRGELETIGIDYYEIKSQQIEHELPRVKRVGVGAYFGYDVLNQQTSLGVSLNYNLFYLF